MHLVVFDIDGTLVESYDFDSSCFQMAIRDVTGLAIDANWGRYRHVTDSGILSEIIETHGFENDAETIVADVKLHFTSRIKEYLSYNDVAPIGGANTFLTTLCQRSDVKVALATGGWSQTAKLKLQAAGIDCAHIPLASASDHINRVEIMRTAESRANLNTCYSKTYFGDGPWDQKASAALGYNFIAVGNRLKYHQSISDYWDTEEIIKYIGL